MVDATMVDDSEMVDGDGHQGITPDEGVDDVDGNDDDIEIELYEGPIVEGCYSDQSSKVNDKISDMISTTMCLIIWVIFFILLFIVPIRILRHGGLGLRKKKSSSEPATVLDLCVSDSDCTNGTSCAFNDYFESFGDRVCCANGESISVGVRNICKGSIKVDDYCGYYDRSSDLICASGVCIDGDCAPGKLKANEVCDSNSHCLDGVCARSQGYWSSITKCCPNGSSVVIGGRRICNGTVPIGGDCRNEGSLSDTICASNVCVKKACAVSKLEAKAICDQNSNCLDGVCAKSNYNYYSNDICCPNGEFVTFAGNKKVCKGVKLGQSCGREGNLSDSACEGEGSFCVKGKCATQKAQPNEACENGYDCESGFCKPDQLFGWNDVCCSKDGFVTYTSLTTEYHVCKNVVRNGDFCGYKGEDSNNMCRSGVCTYGYCASGTSQVTEPCDDNSDCMNNATCAYESYTRPWKACCSNVEIVAIASSNRTICQGIVPLNGTCGNVDSICESGLCINGACAAGRLGAGQYCEEGLDCYSGHCVQSEYRDSSQSVCCDEENLIEFPDKTICMGAAVGASCGFEESLSNLVCESNACIGGTCSSEKADDNESCDDDDDCQSGICGQKEFYHWENVCCKDGLSIEFPELDTVVCKDIPANGSCGYEGELSNSLCDSGACIGGVCASTKVNIADPCEEDSDCQSGVCGKSDYYGDQVCCPRDGFVEFSGVWDISGGKNKTVCTEVPIGGSCGYDDEKSNSICSSGVCVENVCVSEKVGSNETCDDNWDCLNGVCSYDTPLSFWKVCCPSGNTTIVAEVTVCTDIPDGQLCWFDYENSDSACASGMCISGICSSTKAGPNERCDTKADCQTEICLNGFCDG